MKKLRSFQGLGLLKTMGSFKVEKALEHGHGSTMTRTERL